MKTKDYRVIYLSYTEKDLKWKRHSIVVNADSILNAIYNAWERIQKKGELGYHQNTISVKVIRHKKKGI